MKIAIVNTHTYGGAAVVAKRIHQSLLDREVDSLLVTKFGVKERTQAHFFLKDERLRSLALKVATSPSLQGTVKHLKKWLQNPKLVGSPKGFEKFSLLSESIMSDKFDLLEDRDIIHLHWVNEFFEYESFFEKFSHKRFVWTLHDMNPFTGGCHHSDGCLKFENVCEQCPQLRNTRDENYSTQIQDSKLRALKHLRDDQLVITAPSKWLLNLSRKSRNTHRFKHIHVPNPAFRNVRANDDVVAERKRLGLPAQKKIVMFASANLNTPRKGIELLFKAIQSLPERNSIVLLGIGRQANTVPGLDIIYSGSLSDVNLLARYYSVSDVFVTPSLAENSPLVVIESLCCGTPVVASAVGGIPELINDDNGVLFPAGDIAALAKAISSALHERKFNRERIKENALAVHNPMVIAGNFLNIYESLNSSR